GALELPSHPHAGGRPVARGLVRAGTAVLGQRAGRARGAGPVRAQRAHRAAVRRGGRVVRTDPGGRAERGQHGHGVARRRHAAPAAGGDDAAAAAGGAALPGARRGSGTLQHGFHGDPAVRTRRGGAGGHRAGRHDAAGAAPRPAVRVAAVSGWRPSASPETLRRRARLLATAREFFAARGVLEVETPVALQHPVTDVQIASMALQGAPPRWLQTSPEYPMKRLLAAGCGDIYQICHVFRAGESGRLHNPEFTLVEWYRLGFDLEQIMRETAALAAALLEAG